MSEFPTNEFPKERDGFPGSAAPHVMVLGLRGFPGIQGGIETHCERLFPRIAKSGVRVTVIARSPYLPADAAAEVDGIRFARIWAPRSKTLETLVHSVLGVFHAAVVRPDVLHLQGIGPGLVAPLARILGMRVVITHHGPDYDRAKWGRLGKWALRRGEVLGMRFAHARIVISRTIQRQVEERYSLPVDLISNGIDPPQRPATTGALDRFGLEPGRYVLMVGRLVPEKRHDDALKAFAMASMPGWKLVLVGGADHPDAYSRRIMAQAAAAPDVVATGFQRGRALAELYAHAGGFVLPSSHEGLPIALLEALGYGLPVAASDIPANLEVGLPKGCHFPLGDTGALAACMARMASQPVSDAEREALRDWVTRRFNWTEAAARTVAVYARVLRPEGKVINPDRESPVTS